MSEKTEMEDLSLYTCIDDEIHAILRFIYFEYKSARTPSQAQREHLLKIFRDIRLEEIDMPLLWKNLNVERGMHQFGINEETHVNQITLLEKKVKAYFAKLKEEDICIFQTFICNGFIYDLLKSKLKRETIPNFCNDIKDRIIDVEKWKRLFFEIILIKKDMIHNQIVSFRNEYTALSKEAASFDKKEKGKKSKIDQCRYVVNLNLFVNMELFYILQKITRNWEKIDIVPELNRGWKFRLDFKDEK